MNLAATLRDAADQLTALGEGARREAELLLCHVLGKPLSYLRTHDDTVLDADQQQRFRALLEKRKLGEPIAYLLGEREFWSLPFLVTPDTLIPRPETELLVELALQAGDGLAPAGTPLSVVDLGTGSGVIALALASERPHWQLVATDASHAALRIAQKNARRLKRDNVEFQFGSWLTPLAGRRFHLIVSNPPYIASADPHLRDLGFEPQSALVAGNDGLDDIRVIVRDAPAHLQAGGWLLIEHGYDQGEAVRALFMTAGFAGVETRQDLGGNDRVTRGHWR